MVVIFDGTYLNCWNLLIKINACCEHLNFFFLDWKVSQAQGLESSRRCLRTPVEITVLQCSSSFSCQKANNLKWLKKLQHFFGALQLASDQLLSSQQMLTWTVIVHWFTVYWSNTIQYNVLQMTDNASPTYCLSLGQRHAGCVLTQRKQEVEPNKPLQLNLCNLRANIVPDHTAE